MTLLTPVTHGENTTTTTNLNNIKRNAKAIKCCSLQLLYMLERHTVTELQSLFSCPDS